MFAWLTTNIGLITAAVGLLTIFAIFRAPIVALRLQKQVEAYNEKQQRKISIFKTLLATRANTTSTEHVQALNMIDIEFYEEKNIRELWNIYRDHLNTPFQNQNEQDQKYWEDKRIDYLTDLLHGMSIFFGYDFDKVILKKGAYSPVAHGILNLEQSLIRKGFVELLSGNKSIQVELKNKENPSRQTTQDKQSPL